jgi:pyruvate/2-oxoglutarate dehydrogenase complex dihydrolipoamide dehydrogenase (E3) component
LGLNEKEAIEQNIVYEVTRYEINNLDRAITDSEEKGLIKILTEPGIDLVLGVTIIGYRASELIGEYVSTMKHKLGLNKILGTIYIYPTMTEANKFAAGMWKKNHAPQRLLRLVKRYHDCRRN